VKEKTAMQVALDLPAAPARLKTGDALTAPERRTLGVVLGFLGGLAALGPVAGLATATLAWAIARLADSR
jgi:hypothetical protein